MNGRAVGLWGFAATLLLTSLSSSGQALGLTRMDLPFMLGTMITPNRDRAKFVGFLMHLVNGWLFAILYALYFRSLRSATWWLGMAMGLAHSLFVLIVAMPLLPGLHPRMVSEYAGPEPTRQLEPPGFMALNYGSRTPISMILAHLAYGGVLGALYRDDSTEDGSLGSLLGRLKG